MGSLAARSLVSRMLMGRPCCPAHSSYPINHHSHQHPSISRLSKNAVEPDYAFEMVFTTLRFGRGVTQEIGHDLKGLNAKNILVVTDSNVANTTAFKQVDQSLKSHNISFSVFDDVQVEPSDKSMKAAISFARSRRFDAFVAVGGGSVIDTAKAAALYSSNPEAEFLDFVGPPFGRSMIPKNPMLPLIAVPTTAGTGSETTGAAIMDFPEHKCKSGIRLRCIKPMLALVDPLNVLSMPRFVAVYSGFDVLCHALESYTSLPYNQRVPRPKTPAERPLYQGANPVSDVWSLHALNILRKYFRRSIFDLSDEEAKTQMLLAASFAGIGFGNAGVHIAHGLSYPISSQGKKYNDPDYPKNKPLIPHGLSVVTTAAADFEFTAHGCTERHRLAANALGADLPVTANAETIGKTLGDQIRSFTSDFKIPNGLTALGFSYSDLDGLTKAALNSVPNINISPRNTDHESIHRIYEKSLTIY